MMTRIIVAAVLALGVSATSSVAATTASTDCSIASVSGSLECSGYWEKYNDSESLVNELDGGLFGIDTWTQVLKLDRKNGTESVADLVLNVTNQDKKGEWSLTGYDGYESLMFVLKGGNGFSAFLVDPQDTELAGTWDARSMNNKDLSHWSIYGVVGDITSMPIPGAGVLLLGGVGILALRRRRKA